MMKNLKYLIVLALGFFFPSIVFAYELKCDTGEFNYQDYFFCNIVGYKNTKYDYLSGTIEDNDYVSCSIYNVNSSLEKSAPDNKSFYVKGTSSSEKLITYKCQVTYKN